MDCTQFEKLLGEYEVLDSNQRVDMMSHAEECDICAKRLADYMAMQNNLRALPKLTAPEDFLSSLNKRIDDEKIKQERPNLAKSFRMYGYRYGAAAACVVLAAAIGAGLPDIIDKMNNPNNGVISEVDLTDDFDDKIFNSAVETEKPSASPSAAPSASAAPTAAPAVKPSATAKPLATAIPSAAKATTKPKATATAKPEVKATAKPEAATQTPAEPAVTDAPPSTEVQTFHGGDAPSVTAASASAIPAPSDANNEPNVPAAASVLEPEVYALPTQAAGGRRSVPESNAIEVSYANAERAKEIINEYSMSSDGDCYNVSADVLDEMLAAMSSAGIEIDESSIEMNDDTVTFRLIIS
ncbi:MAG: hypothetical protein SOS24_07075 [Clostridia bacterium]|nr:hypothetical protein [Clostridia bacterium]